MLQAKVVDIRFSARRTEASSPLALVSWFLESNLCDFGNSMGHVRTALQSLLGKTANPQ